MSCARAAFVQWKATTKLARLKATTQKVGITNSELEISNLEVRFSRFFHWPVFVMIVQKCCQTVLSVLFAAVVGIVSARGPQTVISNPNYTKVSFSSPICTAALIENLCQFWYKPKKCTPLISRSFDIGPSGFRKKLPSLPRATFFFVCINQTRHNFISNW